MSSNGRVIEPSNPQRTLCGVITANKSSRFGNDQSFKRITFRKSATFEVVIEMFIRGAHIVIYLFILHIANNSIKMRVLVIITILETTEVSLFFI